MALRKLPTFRKSRSKVDFNDPETRAAILKEFGVEPPKPKANVLQRITSALSAFETGNAIFKAIKTGDVGEGVSQYVSDIFKGLGGAITGDVDKEKKTFSDVLGQLGLKKGVPRDILGFIGDVGLDPSTYVTIGVGGGSKVGGKALTGAGKAVFKEGEELAGRLILSKIGKDLTEEGMVVGLKSFAKDAAKMGIELNVLNKGPVEVAKEFAEKRLFKFVDKTGAKLTKEGAEKLGVKLGEEVFEESAFRFAGKKLFTLDDGMKKLGLKSYFDPISTVGELAGKTPIGQQATNALGNMIFPIRKLFSRSAELAGTKNAEYLFKDLIDATIGTMNKTRFANSQVEKAAKEFYDRLIESKVAPETFGIVFENTPKELIDKLPADLQQKTIQVMGQIKQLSQQATEGGDALASVVKAQVDALPKDTALTATQKQLVHKDKLFELAKTFEDPFEKLDSNLLGSDQNIGEFVDLVTQGRVLAEEKTGLLVDVGYIDKIKAGDDIVEKMLKAGQTTFADPKTLTKGFAEGIDVPYLMRIVVQTPSGKLTEFMENAGKVAAGKGAFKKRDFEFLAELISKGGITTTSDKIGKESAVAFADLIGKTNALHAKASAFIDLEGAAKTMKDSLGNNIFQTAEEVGESAIRSGAVRQVKSTLTGKTLFEGKYAPKEVVDMLEKTHKSFFTDKGTNEFLTVFDKIQGFWKRSVTAWFPAFHTRNAASNVFANTMAGVKNPRVYKDALDLQRYSNLVMQKGVDSKIVTRAGRKVVGKTGFTFKELLNVAEKNGVVGAGTFWDEIAEKGFQNPKNLFGRLKSAPTDFGNAIEDNAKLAHFVDKLEKGNSIEEAANSVKKYLFDYGDLSNFEKNVMRRIVPFWTWARKNAELHIKEMATQPGKYSTILKGFRSAQEMFSDIKDEDIKKLPLWVRNGVQVIRGADGQASVVQGFGTPIEAFSSFVGGFAPEITGDPTVLSSLSPILKTPLERIFDKNLFTGKQISKDISAKQFQGMLSKMPQAIKNAVGYQEIERETRQGKKYTEYLVNPDAKFIINSLFGRLAATGGRISTIGEGGNLVDVLSGLKTYNFNLAEEEERREKELTKALFDELERQGLAKQFTTQFLTKEAKRRL